MEGTFPSCTSFATGVTEKGKKKHLEDGERVCARRLRVVTWLGFSLDVFSSVAIAPTLYYVQNLALECFNRGRCSATRDASAFVRKIGAFASLCITLSFEGLGHARRDGARHAKL